jgi:predicted CoA-binding protein
MFATALERSGKTVFLVDSRGGTLGKRPVCPSLAELGRPVDAALIVCEPARALDAVRECLAAGVTRVWLDSRGNSKEAAEAARAAGAELVEERCPLLTIPNAGFIHGLHRSLLRAFGRLPAD